MVQIRSAVFLALYTLSGIWFGTTALLLQRNSFATRFAYLRNWNRFVLFLSRTVVGIHIDVRGLDNIPNEPCVVMSKHQSQWETIYLQTIFSPLCTILKQELLSIPFYGWGLKQMEPIAIDRGAPRQALKQVQQLGRQRLQQGRSILVFPEGTRVAVGETRRYAKSGAQLAVGANAPILPIAHNAGLVWPGGFKKYAGTVSVVIGKPLCPGDRSPAELTAEVEQWVEQTSNALLDPGNSDTPAQE